MSAPRYQPGECFAYFRWHCLRYPACPPFSAKRGWRFGEWIEMQLAMHVSEVTP